MKNYIVYATLLVTLLGFSQKKVKKFFDENGTEINRRTFLNNKDYSKNIDVQFEDDSIQYNLLAERLHYGEFNKEQLQSFKNYLNEISDRPKIDSTQYIVINYLSSSFVKSKHKSKSTWNIFDSDYIKELHKNQDVSHFWITSPKNTELKYFHNSIVNWIPDINKVFNKIFYKHEVRYGYFIVINPKGLFCFYLGEYSKHQVWDVLEKFKSFDKNRNSG